MNAGIGDDVLTYLSVQRFLFHEATLLDERRFEEWLQVCAPDIRYWMPAQQNVQRDREHLRVGGEHDLPLFDETWEHLQQRVRRLETGQAWAEEPPSRTRRLITNVQIRPGADDGVIASSNFMLYRSRHETDVELFAGSRVDLLRPHRNHGWQIAARTVVLDATTIPAHNLSVFF
jgi:chlorobenzene dioxygenase small subunit/biphenyl 2,3-dioxygenase beta subunit